ncbi:MAG: lactonase family protein [Gorillibacterium sp.]|nr:lactonase family protein [Gorillibacterium sp.]
MNPKVLPQAETAGKLVDVWVGTYSGKEESSIHLLSFDEEHGHLGLKRTVQGVERPSFLALNRTGDTLYAVEERTAGDGSLVSLTYEPEDSAWVVRNRYTTSGVAPCHLCLDDTERFLFVVNYGGGQVLTYPIMENGTLGEQVGCIQHRGHSIHKDRQEAPHPHSVNWNPDSGLLFVPDLGLDQIVAYHMDPDSGQLTQEQVATVHPGAGPRHFVFHPSLPHAYVINELDSTVTMFSYVGREDKLTSIQTISTLPVGYNGDNAPADLHISQDGAFLYGSNRGHDSIVVYAINVEDGSLSVIEHVATGGSNPRNFSLSPDGSYLLAANQDSDNIVIFHVDKKTGKLTPTGSELAVNKPVCIIWGNAATEQ